MQEVTSGLRVIQMSERASMAVFQEAFQRDWLSDYRLKNDSFVASFKLLEKSNTKAIRDFQGVLVEHLSV